MCVFVWYFCKLQTNEMNTKCFCKLLCPQLRKSGSRPPSPASCTPVFGTNEIRNNVLEKILSCFSYNYVMLTTECTYQTNTSIYISRIPDYLALITTNS